MPPIVVPFHVHMPAKYASATRKPCGGPPTTPPRMLTKTTSRKAAPMRSQKLALGYAHASGGLAMTAAAPPVPGKISGAAVAEVGGGSEAVVIGGTAGSGCDR